MSTTQLGLAGLYKFAVFVVVAVMGSAGVTFFDGAPLGAGELVNVLVVAAGAVVLFFKQNTPTQPWARFLVGLFTAAATVLAAAWTDGVITGTEFHQLVMAVLGFLAVGATADRKVDEGGVVDQGAAA